MLTAILISDLTGTSNVSIEFVDVGMSMKEDFMRMKFEDKRMYSSKTTIITSQR